VEAVQVFYGLVFKEGDRILASVAEYATNYIAFLQVTPILTHRRSSLSSMLRADAPSGSTDRRSAKHTACRRAKWHHPRSRPGCTDTCSDAFYAASLRGQPSSNAMPGR